MRSMTGYGRGEAVAAGWRVDVELSGGNRKQIDLALNLPSSLLSLESELRSRLASAVSRGRVVAKVVATRVEVSGSSLFCNEALARQYREALANLASALEIPMDLSVSQLLRAQDVFRIEDSGADPEMLGDAVLAALDAALLPFTAMQTTEGQHLQRDLAGRLNRIEDELHEIRQRAPGVSVTYRENLMKRLSEADIPFDLGDDRIVREVALFAERCDITEELTRLDSHIALFRSYLASEDATGRSLDFLCQEMNREINTIGSKANDAAIAHAVVRAKAELEKIREQVQNVQ